MKNLNKNGPALRGKFSILFLFCCLTCIRQSLQAQPFKQSEFWYVGSQFSNQALDQVGFGGGISNNANINVWGTLGIVPVATYVTNGAYWIDPNDNSMVTDVAISDNQIYQYYNGTGRPLGQPYDNALGLNGYGPFTTSSGEGSFLPGTEVGLIPVPGSECGTYYIIYSNSLINEFDGNVLSEWNLCYNIYDINAQALSYPIASAPQLGGQLFTVQEGTLPQFFTPGIAIGQLNNNKQRYLYAVCPNMDINGNISTNVNKYVIDANGIGPAIPEATFPGVWINPPEVELSFDQTMLAFANVNGPVSINGASTDVVVLLLDAGTGDVVSSSPNNGVNLVSLSAAYNGNTSFCTGLEFTPDNNALYINIHGLGIYQMPINHANIELSPLSATIVALSDKCSNSQLELSYYNTAGTSHYLICAVKDPYTITGGTDNELQYFDAALPFIDQTMASFAPVVNFTYPSSQFTTFQYQQCKGVWTLQDQVDGDDYSTWSTPSNSPQCCLRATNANPNIISSYTVKTNETWTVASNSLCNCADPIVQNNITVAAGATLYIENLTIQFYPGASLQIMPGGTVNLLGSTLTGLDCGTMWQGVEVMGTNGEPQTPAYQGMLVSSEFNGRSSIQNAVCGVQSQNGGIVVASSTDFLDNTQDVYFQNPGWPILNSVSKFSSCTFTVDNNYLASTYKDRVMLEFMRGIYFDYCLFEDDNGSFYMDQAQHGQYNMNGIVAVDANFKCIASKFNNLQWGIWASRLFFEENFVVKGCSFDGNEAGIVSGAVDYFNCTQNAFTIGDNYGPELHGATGIVSEKCSNYTIAYNTFNGSTGGSAFIRAGCYIKDSGPWQNLVNNNAYNDLFIANWAYGQNRDPANDYIGLLYLCNTQSKNDIDWLINGDYWNAAINGIREDQFTLSGSSTVSPDNTFSNSAFNDWSDIYLDNNSCGQNIVYATDDPTEPEPSLVTNSVTPLVLLPTADLSRSCGFHPLGLVANVGASYNSAADALIGSAAAYNTNSCLYKQLIDAGSTPTLTQDISTQWDGNSFTMYNNLMGYAPNLSTDILKNVAQANYLNASLLYEICTSNPSSTKDAGLQNILQTALQDSMTDEMLQQILNQEILPSYRRSLEAAMNTAVTDVGSVADTLIAGMLTDSTQDNTDSIEAMLAAIPHFTALYKLAEMKIASGDYGAAAAILQSIPSQYTNVECSDPKFNDYADFMNLLMLVRTEVLDSNAVDSNTLTQLIAIASDSTRAGYLRANNILVYLGNWSWKPTFNLPVDFLASGKNSPQARLKPKPSTYLKVYPNPANEYVTVEFNLKTVSNNLELRLTDNTGTTVYSSELQNINSTINIQNIDTRKLQTGSYVISLVGDDKTLGTTQFVKGQ